MAWHGHKMVIKPGRSWPVGASESKSWFVSYHVVPEDMSEVSELSLFLSWTILKSANFEKSVFP
jgi:hypothetical protein